MSPVAVVLVVIAAFAHAGWNTSAKRAGAGGVVFVWLSAALSVAVVAPVAVVDVLVSGAHPAWSWLLAVGVSGLLHLAYFVLLQRGYAEGDMSVVYPLARGTGPLLSVLFAVVLLGERPGAVALAGALAVVAGVFVIGGLGSSSGSGSRRAGVAYGLVTGVTITAYTLWDAHAVTTLTVPPLVQLAGSVTVQAAALTPVALAKRPEIARMWREHRWNAASVAVLSPAAYGLVLYALRIAPVALVAPARELSIVIGGIIAWRVLHEPNPARRLVGAAIVLAGVFALAVG
ncbi:MAG TPA: DMT family transporter [Pseudonocardiaceae bacterium]|jgi:drug/metabolite transporter (DMT)-like permease|nr:DMT family transporter [Pseudonocardiaceae bacterium]